MALKFLALWCLMSTGRAIQVSVLHTFVGLAIGSVIEGVLPSYTEGSSVANQAFEALVQVGLNGAALAAISPLLANDDPTFGIPFSLALYASQPQLELRVRLLGASLKDEVARVVQRRVPQTATHLSATPI